MQPKALTKWRQLLQIFREDDGRTHGDIFTPTQIQVVDLIAKRRFPRTQLIMPTQYGKSLAVADGVLLRIAEHKEQWAIVAPTEDKARIIMDYIIDHIFDDAVFSEQLEYYGSKEKLKQERSKVRITFRDGGEVRVYSGNASNSKQTMKALMGFGAPNVILDESSLIPNDLYATVKRMVGGHVSSPGGSFLLEIGNPFNRNHFMRTWFGDRYQKIYLNADGALAEGRYTKDYLDEMRDEAFYEVLYDCVFPAESEVLSSGYRRLLQDAAIDGAYIEAMLELTPATSNAGELVWLVWEGDEIVDLDKPLLGIDVAGTGSDECKFVIRFPLHNFSMVVGTMSGDDLEVVADKTEELIAEWGITDYRAIVDAGGVGHGLPGIMRRRGHLIKAVMFGESAPHKSFRNIRAWMYWEGRNWILRSGGKLVRDEGFEEIKLIYYRADSTGKTQIEPKPDMIKRNTNEGNNVKSPDTADAFVLTFVDTSAIVEEDDIVID